LSVLKIITQTLDAKERAQIEAQRLEGLELAMKNLGKIAGEALGS
jgi:hypothetical protein